MSEQAPPPYLSPDARRALSLLAEADRLERRLDYEYESRRLAPDLVHKERAERRLEKLEADLDRTWNELTSSYPDDFIDRCAS